MQHSVADSWTVCVCVYLYIEYSNGTHTLTWQSTRSTRFIRHSPQFARTPSVCGAGPGRAKGAGKREGWGGQAREREREGAAQWALGWLCGLSSLASVLAHYECRWIKRREIEFFGACWSRNWNWNCLMPQQFSYSFTFPHSLFTIYPSRDPFLCAGVFQLSGFPVAVE